MHTQMLLPLALPAATAPAGPEESIEAKIERAITRLMRLLQKELVVCAWSAGKDSTAVGILTLEAARRLSEQGVVFPPVVFLHTDTEVENPVIRTHAEDMIEALESWAAKVGIPVRVVICRPKLSATFAVKILSGGQLPSWPDHKRRCSPDWKLEPARAAFRHLLPRIRKDLAASAATGNATDAARLAIVEATPVPVTLIGTRRDESVVRARNMSKRGDDAEDIAEVDGRRLLAPIAEWSEMDVWEVVGTAGTTMGLLPVWCADFSETVALYRDAASGECPVIAGTRAAGRAACGARFGCHMCQAVRDDRSLSAMTEDPRYHHLTDLLRIRNFISAIQYDWTRRNWLSRQFKDIDGVLHVKIHPDHFDADTLRLLVGAYLTADRREAERAAAFAQAVRSGRDPNDHYVAQCRREGTTPDPRYMRRMCRRQFQVIPARHAVALDFYSAVLGKYQKPYEVMELVHRVWALGEDIDVPNVEAVPPTPAPEPRWLPLCPADKVPYTIGLADPLLGMFEECFTPEDIHTVGGERIYAYQTGSFDVDEEGAAMVVNFYYEDDLRTIREQPGSNPWSTVRSYLSLGTVSLSPQGRTRLHEVVRQREVLRVCGVHGMTRKELIAASVPDRKPAAPEPPSLLQFAAE